MNVAIIAAAGQGVRMGNKRAKQFLELDGIPVIIHTLKRFEQCPDIHQIVVVLPEENVKGFPALAKKYRLKKVTNCVRGGFTRLESVRFGMAAIQRVKTVAVHDGVRPFVTPEEISQTLKKAGKSGAAILVAPVTDTIKLVQVKSGVSRAGWVKKTLPRNDLRRALTPQCFAYELLYKVMFSMPQMNLIGQEITDESMLVEPLGPVDLVEGHPRNIEITQPEDIALAELILKRNPEFKIRKPR